MTTPTKITLNKYGLSVTEWEAILEAQGGRCAICKKVPSTGRFVTDHEHVRGWKAMPPEKRKLYVRGITCWWCNETLLARGVTVEKARNLVDYLHRYETQGTVIWTGYEKVTS